MNGPMNDPINGPMNGMHKTSVWTDLALSCSAARFCIITNNFISNKYSPASQDRHRCAQAFFLADILELLDENGSSHATPLVT